jgi:hypothetical protein
MPQFQRAAHHALLEPRVGVHGRTHAVHITSVPVWGVQRKQCSPQATAVRAHCPKSDSLQIAPLRLVLHMVMASAECAGQAHPR